MSDIVIVIFGSPDSRSAQGLAGAAAPLGGASRTVVVEGEYQPEPVLDALVDACRGASVVLLANDTYSQEVAPRLAHRLGGACVGDGVDVRMVDGRLRVTRQVYGGKANAVIELRRSPAVVWLRARSFAVAPITGSFAVSAAQDDRANTRIVERKVAAENDAKLEDAQVIVSGGRGIGGPEGFRDELEPLAKLLGAQMAASRAACDAGWVPPTWQVGQTGKKVAPELYLAVAITGASQHMAGISEAKNIVAINIDPDAPIFKHCRFGIVEDYRKVVPLLRRKLEELRT
ncbi:MAG TPA: electron transfer flavoprotein subunit alpha/FixB family protein [Thermoanaerobaculia bacterium]|jgi:electron transfer flavoprotein alpha subunit|nr:electron transfer flavoprotein subunit alpha/FixB family protein [Thermoanaerobaculia bacterium]